MITAIMEFSAEPSFTEGKIFKLLWWKLSSLHFKMITLSNLEGHAKKKLF